MKLHCRFIFQYSSPATAEKIRDSLEVDNYRFIHTKLDNDKLIAEIESDSLMSLLHTTEDYLSCLSTAENMIAQTKKNLSEDR